MTSHRDRMRVEAVQWLLLLAEEPEDEALQIRFEQWLDADPDHVRTWAHVVETDAAIFTSPVAAPSPSPPPRVTPRDRRRAGRWRQVRRRPGRLILGTVAAGVAALLAGPSLLLHIRADHMTGAGAVRHIALSDGSSVDLGPSSSIAVSYTAQGRDIRLLSGQAWFDVAPNPQRPFRVTTGSVTATALGTAFDVRRIGSGTSVEVDHGRVRVTQDEQNAGQAPVLSTGQWMRFAPGQPPRAGREQPQLIGAWRSGELMAREATIAELVEELRPWYGGRIMLLDSAMGQKRISGFYNARNPVDALRTIVHPHGGSVTQVTPWLLIVSH